MEFILIWLLCGVIAGVIANSRGGSAMIGGLLGFLLGPFGVALAFFLGGEKEREAAALADGLRKKCPMCAELVQPEAQVCKHCGHRLEPADPAEA